MDNGTLKLRLEQWSAGLLAAATLVTAYSAYEATRWGGEQSTKFTQAGATRTKSAKENSRGYSLVTIDATLFTDIAAAYFEENKDLVGFLRTRLRTEFKPAFNEWLDEDPLDNPDAKPTPFQLPSYEPEALVKADEFDQEADQLFTKGREANQTSDNYVLATIFFAAVLFFGGIASKFDSQRVVLVCLSFATLVFFGGLVRLLTLPFL
ncbi:MAG: hypothetical protein R2725_05375 [Solirubrobacterales bacterium]